MTESNGCQSMLWIGKDFEAPRRGKWGPDSTRNAATPRKEKKKARMSENFQ